MRKTVIILCTALSGLMILDSLDAGHAIAMLLLAGVIPGTDLIVGASQMMALYSLLTGFVLARIATAIVRRLPVRQAA